MDILKAPKDLAGFLDRVQHGIIWGMLFLAGFFVAISALFGWLYYIFLAKAPKQSPNFEIICTFFFLLFLGSAALAYYAHKKFKAA